MRVISNKANWENITKDWNRMLLVELAMWTGIRLGRKRLTEPDEYFKPAIRESNNV